MKLLSVCSFSEKTCTQKLKPSILKFETSKKKKIQLISIKDRLPDATDLACNIDRMLFLQKHSIRFYIHGAFINHFPCKK